MAATSSIFNTPISTFNPSSTRRSTTARFTAAYTSIDRSTSTSHYEILGINSTATWQEIKQAYRKLARVSHPDVVSSGADEFMRIHSAYATLSDPEKRADYDRTIFGNRRGVNEFGLATASYGYARADTTSFGSRRWETDQCW